PTFSVCVGLLLTVSLLSSWHLSTNAHVTIEKVPTLVAEGDNVIFHVHDLPENITTLAWFKGLRNTTQGITAYAPLLNLSRPGPVYSGRETIYHNGSLLIENVNPMDTGFYTLRTYNTHGTRTSVTSTYLQVHEPVTQPFVQITNTTVTGRRSVIFSCISPDTDVSIRWIFNKENLQLTERMTLSPTKCGLRIDPVSSTDAGLYQCEVSNRFSSKISLPVSWP
ncbi:Carcinoembryonic antigen-related cell adhesion molecule 15, partial [Lemmus lemmus]